jgi:hypothetical protein
MTPEDRAGRDLPSLQGNLHALIALSEAAFPVNIGRRSHLQFMLASFAIKQHEHGYAIDSRVERDIRARLRRYDHWFLTKTAREARMVGHALPVDPYVRNWYSERETEIFRDVEGDKLLEYAYGPFSEWHH